jgi:hypothetical protein
MPNAHKIYQMALNIPNGPKIFQMSMKYTNIFNYKTLKNVPNFAFLVCKYTTSGNPALARLWEPKPSDFDLNESLWVREHKHRKW